MTQPMKFQAEWNGKAVEDGIDRILARVKGLTATLAEQGQQQVVATQQSGQRVVAEVDRTEKQRIAIQRASISVEEGLQAKREAEARKTSERLIVEQDRAEKQRITLQRASINQEEALRVKREVDAKTSTARIARAEYDLAVAQAGSTTERFERLKLIENANNKLRLSRMIGNDKEMEIEAERHAAKLEAIEAQAGAFSSTPFQKLLGHLGTLTGRKTNEIRESGEAALGLIGVEAEGGGKAAAAELGGAGAAGGAMAGGMMAATAAAGLLVVGLYEATKAAKGAREAEEGLESSLKTSGREETLATDRLEAYAEALARTTKFSKDQALAAESMLLPFRNLSNEEIPKLLAISADLAAKMGKSLPEAAVQLGRAFEDPEKAGRALREANIILTDSEVKQLKQWQLAGQMGAEHEFLFKRLGEAVGGYAKATVHNTEIVGHKWEELEAIVGKSVLKIGDAIASLFVGDDEGKSGRNQLSQIERINKELEEKEIAAIRARYMHGRATTQQEIAAMNAAIETFRKQEAAKAAARPEGAIAKTREQLDEEFRLTQEVEKAKTESIGIEGERRLALERIEHETKLRELGPYYADYENRAHAFRVAQIEQDERVRASTAEREAKYSSASIAFQQTLLKNKRKLRDDEEAADIQHTAEVRLKQNAEQEKFLRDNANSAMKPGVKRDLAESKGREQDELNAFNLSERAKYLSAEKAEQVRTNIAKRYSDERIRIQHAEDQAIVAASATLAQNIGEALQALAGKNRTLAKTGMRITEAGAIANTAGGIMKAFDQGGVLGFLTGAAIGAEGIKQVATIESQISKFATGTDYAPGGMAMVGERGPEMVYLPRGSKVKTASETRQMAGGMPPVTINVHPTAGMSPADGREFGRQAGIGYVDILKQHVQRTKDAADWGVTA
jgi:hypothetical protein